MNGNPILRLDSDSHHPTMTEGMEAQDELPPPPEAAKKPFSSKGTILEGAFVDPAYNWPPADGQGKNAIELQASLQLLGVDNDDDSMATTETTRQRMQEPDLPVGRRFFCCRDPNAAVSPEQMQRYREKKAKAEEARMKHLSNKKKRLKQKEREERTAKKYESVPEGILIYRLDTSSAVLELVSNTHSNTPETILRRCNVAQARAAPHKSRRAIEIVDDTGHTHIITACEQRTATAWLEAAQLLHAKNSQRGLFRGGKVMSGCSNDWKVVTHSLHVFRADGTVMKT